jgi:hypothetical protein
MLTGHSQRPLEIVAAVVYGSLLESEKVEAILIQCDTV